MISGTVASPLTIAARGDAAVRAVQAVHEEPVGPDGQGLDGARHGEQRGLEDVDLVDLVVRRPSEGPGHVPARG